MVYSDHRMPTGANRVTQPQFAKNPVKRGGPRRGLAAPYTALRRLLGGFRVCGSDRFDYSGAGSRPLLAFMTAVVVGEEAGGANVPYVPIFTGAASVRADLSSRGRASSFS